MSKDKSNPPRPPVTEQPAASATHEEWLAYVRDKIEGTKYGSLQIVVHDGRIMQVEATEKIRLQPPPRPPAS